MDSPYELGRFIYMPGKYVVCFHVIFSAECLNKPGVLSKTLKIFAKKGVSIVNFKLSRPKPDKPIEASIFADLTGVDRLKEEELIKELKNMECLNNVSLIGPLFKGITIDNEFSRLTMSGRRAVILRSTVYRALLKNLRKKMGASFMAVLYHAGLEIGRDVYEELSQITEGDPAMTAVLGQEIFKQVGFGTARIELDLKRRSATVRVWDCFECELFKGSGKPASHFVRGMIAGFLGGIFGENVYADEIKCIAAANKCCEFQVRRDNRIF